MLKVNSDEQLIAQIFDSQPEAAVWFCPVLSGNGSDKNSIEDFEARYCNLAAAEILGVSPSDVIGAHLMSTSLVDEMSRNLIFEQCVQVYTTGYPIDFTYFSSGLDRYFSVHRSKVRNGILSITHDRTKQVKAELEYQE